jgi:hypothetical protein
MPEAIDDPRSDKAGATTDPMTRAAAREMVREDQDKKGVGKKGQRYG